MWDEKLASEAAAGAGSTSLPVPSVPLDGHALATNIIWGRTVLREESHRVAHYTGRCGGCVQLFVWAAAAHHAPRVACMAKRAVHTRSVCVEGGSAGIGCLLASSAFAAHIQHMRS